MSETQEKFQGEAYQPQEDVFFDDGREIELLHYVYGRPDLAEIRGRPQRVLDAIDDFGRTRKYLMNVGEHKATTVVDLIRQQRPRTMVELGGYVGYSAIAFAAALRDAHGDGDRDGGRYFSLEKSPEFGAVITMLADLAGLRDVVTVVVGASADSLRRLHAEGALGAGERPRIDLLFLDHYKPAYTTDLKLCEELGLVGPGSVYAADNVIKPGNPPYLEYVRSTVAEKRERASKAAGSEPKGNPNLVYESELVKGWEPSGVPDALEITKCTGIQD
ncbi:catechol O-methyltransferase [Xylariaceae sp. FL0804]|nr:catechol O-methyltransferase [Xylariaceae sp. FL0804]